MTLCSFFSFSNSLNFPIISSDLQQKFQGSTRSAQYRSRFHICRKDIFYPAPQILLLHSRFHRYQSLKKGLQSLRQFRLPFLSSGMHIRHIPAREQVTIRSTSRRSHLFLTADKLLSHISLIDYAFVPFLSSDFFLFHRFSFLFFLLYVFFIYSFLSIPISFRYP